MFFRVYFHLFILYLVDSIVDFKNILFIKRRSCGFKFHINSERPRLFSAIFEKRLGTRLIVAQGPVVQKPVNVNPGLVEILWPKL